MSSRTDYFFKYQLRSLWPWFSDFGVSVSVLEPLSLGLGLEQMGLDNKSGVKYYNLSLTDLPHTCLHVIVTLMISGKQ